MSAIAHGALTDPTHFEAGELTDMEELVTEHWDARVTLTLSGDTYPDTTTEEDEQDGFISGTGTLVTVGATTAALPGGNPSASRPTLVSVHLDVEGETHYKEPGTPNANTAEVSMRFASTHFTHGSAVVVTGTAVFELDEALFTIQATFLEPEVYNALLAWLHGDILGYIGMPTGTALEDWLLARQFNQNIVENVASHLRTAFVSQGKYYLQPNIVNAWSKSQVLERTESATGMLSVTHGEPTRLESSTGFHDPPEVQSIYSGEFTIAWSASGTPTPPSHFSIVYACTTIENGSSPISQSISTRATGGAWIGFPGSVAIAQPDPNNDAVALSTLADHAEKLIEGLGMGMCAGDAVTYANNLIPYYSASVAGSPMATLGSVYLTQDERDALGNSPVDRVYNYWYKKL